MNRLQAGCLIVQLYTAHIPCQQLALLMVENHGDSTLPDQFDEGFQLRCTDLKHCA